MSATSLKRSLRQRKIHNYLDVSRGRSSDTFSNQNDSNIDLNVSVTSNQETSATRNPPNGPVSIKSEPDSLNESNDSDGLFSKKMKISDEASHAEHMGKASITLKRTSVPQAPAPSHLDKNDDLGIFAVDDEDDGNEYRRERQKQLLDRQIVLKSIDFDEGIEELKTIAKSRPKVEAVRKIARPAVKRPLVKRETETIRRRSARLQNQSINLTNDGVDEDPSKQNSKLDAVSISFDASQDKEIDENLTLESEQDHKFLESLKDTINVPYKSVSDFTTCDFDKFEKTLKMCYMFGEPEKVIKTRIVSMDIHPSEQKLLLLVGDKHGNVALRDLVTYDGIEIKGHEYNVNCVQFSLQDSSKFYSTSLDGTVRIGDINASSLNLLYKTDYHTTWHHERGNTLYIAKGDGSVHLLDLRSPNDNHPSFNCHSRSVRTVQTHPLDENYFLTSSGTGFFGIWDVRQMKAVEPEPIILENFSHALTSAFYSAKGNYVLTTCNDDAIRVFDVTNNQSKQISRTSHNNHTGRWLSVFKAKWQPNREDCFYVGSMMQPRRMQAYTEKGTLFREFRSDSMGTVNSVISVHPTKPIIVGGNASGRIHIFSPFRDLTDI